MWALQAYWHPSTPDHTKSKWADLYGVSKQLLNKYEGKEGIGTIAARFRAGEEPPPPLPPLSKPSPPPAQADVPKPDDAAAGSVQPLPRTAASPPGVDSPIEDSSIEDSRIQLVHGVNVTALKAELTSKCTRAGDRAQYGKKGSVGMYREGVKWAELQMASKKLSGEKAAAVLKAIGVSVGSDSLYKKLRADGGCETVAKAEVALSPAGKHGHNISREIIPPKAKEEITKWVNALRALRAKPNPKIILAASRELLRGTAHEGALDGKTGKLWYYRFAKSWGALKRTARPLEIDRAKYETNEKFLPWYIVVEDAMVAANIAIYNDKFDPSKPYDYRIIITHPELVFSFDQTGFSVDMSEASHSSDGKLTTFDPEDNGDSLANKCSTRCTITGGSTMAGGGLPGLITYKKASLLGRSMQHAPRSAFKDENGKPRKATFFPHPSGGFSKEMAAGYIRNNIASCLPPRTDGRKAFGLMDGFSVHLCPAMVEAAEDEAIDLQLRIPHTSRKSQGEDVENFAYFKPHARDNLGALLLRKIQTGKTLSISDDEIPKIIKEPWEEAFAPDRNRRGWAKIGFPQLPGVGFVCDRAVFWDLKSQEEKRAAPLASVGVELKDLKWKALRVTSGQRHACEDPDGESSEESLSEHDSDSELDEDEKNARITSKELYLEGPITCGRGKKKLAAMRERQKETADAKQQRKDASDEKKRMKEIAMQKLAVDSAKKLWEAQGDHTRLKCAEMVALLMRSSTAGVTGKEKLDELRAKFAAATTKEDCSWQDLVKIFYTPPPLALPAPGPALPAAPALPAPALTMTLPLPDAPAPTVMTPPITTSDLPGASNLPQACPPSQLAVLPPPGLCQNEPTAGRAKGKQALEKLENPRPKRRKAS
jgi:hypothetical protein